MSRKRPNSSEISPDLVETDEEISAPQIEQIKRKPQREEVIEIQDDEIGLAKPKPRSVKVIELQDDPVAPPAVERCNDKRTKQELLQKIAELETELKSFSREAFNEQLEHQRAVDNRAGRELYEKTLAERDEARTHCADLQKELAVIGVRVKENVAVITNMREGRASVEELGNVLADLSLLVREHF